MSKKVVLIVGAGGTRADVDDEGERKPPLDRGFFRQLQSGDPAKFSVVQSYCRDQYAMDILIEDHDSLEGVFATLYADCFGPGEMGNRAYVALRALVDLLIEELKVTTNPIPVSPENFVYRFIHSTLAKGVRPENITIITFNYDLHIERALELLNSRERRRKVFQFPGLYRVDYEKCSSPSNNPENVFPISDRANGLQLLKLHGSLNWYSRHESLDLPQEVLFDQHKRLFVTRRRIIEPFMSVSGSQVAFPIIIPPVVHKAGVMPEVMKPLWKHAEDALRRANEVYILGYSCPSTDHESANMIRRVFRTAGNHPVKDLHIIDPNPSVVVTYARLTGCDCLQYYANCEAFLERQDLDKIPSVHASLS